MTFAEAPGVGAAVELVLDPGVIEDYYNNATTEPITFSFTWPATDTILNDTRAPRLDRASVIEGCVEMVFDEEIDPATWSAATIDQGAVDWASCENGFGLCQQNCLAAGGSHTLELGATLADLAGNALDGGAVGHGFDVSATETLHIWRRPDPRLLTSATGAAVEKSVSSAVRQALGFHGLPIDPETGLVYVRHRYYDPEMGRFIGQDPLGYVDGGNLYQYGLNNPGDLSDPLGLYTGSQEDIDYLLQFSTNNPGDQAAIARAQRTAISNAVGIMPGVGDAHDLVQASAGVDVITGDRLSARDRAVVVVAAAVPFVGGPALRWAAGTAPGRWVMDGVGWLWSKVPKVGEQGFARADLLTGLLMPTKAGRRPGVPPVGSGDFGRWFDSLTTEELDALWADKRIRASIERRLRSPGGLHEWHMVARTPTFKRWGLRADQIQEMRTLTKDAEFINPSGRHGGPGSTMAHNEILQIIDSSDSYEMFVRRLQNWADHRLRGGAGALPGGLRR